MKEESMAEDDLMEGARKIGRYIGISTRRVYHLAASGELPVFRLGKVIHGRKSTLDRFFAERERAGNPDKAD